MPMTDPNTTASAAWHVCSTAELGGPKERCHADRDGDCVHANCPQLRDGEPKATGRHCPLDVDDDDDLWLDDDGDWCDRCNGDGREDKHDTFETARPKCPHCGYELDDDDMLSSMSDEDLYALAPDEKSAVVQCPQCDREYAVRGGYRPHYTSAFSLDEL